MILLQKRRIILVLSCVFVSIFTYFLSNSKHDETLQTVSLPVTNKVVILDAGHRRRRPRC